MKCKHVRKELSAYLDGEVSAPARIGIEKHLAKCPECERYKKELSLVTESLRRLGRIEPSASFYSETMRRIRTTASVPASRKVVARGWAVAFASCIVVGLFVLGWLVLSENRGGPGPSDLSLTEMVALTFLMDDATDESPDETWLATSFAGPASNELPLLLATSYSDSISVEEMIETLSDSEKTEFRAALLNLAREGQNNAG